MNIIHGSIPKEKAAVFSAFHQVVEHLECSGTLFLAFPIVDISGASSVVDALLISPEFGLVAFDLETATKLTPEQVGGRQDDIYVGLQSRLIKHEPLRLDRRALAFEIHTLTFAPFLSQPIGELASSDLSTSGPVLFEAIDQCRRSEPLSPDIVRRIIAVVQAVDKIRSAKKARIGVKPESRASVLAHIESQIANLDTFQNRVMITSLLLAVG